MLLHWPICKAQGKHLTISLSNFDGQFPNILFMCLCLCAKVLSVVTVTEFQSARSVCYFLVRWDFNFYARRRLFLNIWVKRDMNNI